MLNLCYRFVVFINLECFNIDTSRNPKILLTFIVFSLCSTMCLPLIVVGCYFVIRLTIRMHSIFNIFTNKTKSTTIYLMSLLSTTWGIVSLSFSRFSSIHFSIIAIFFLRGMLRISDLIRKFEHYFRIIVLFDTNFRTHIIMGRKEDSKQKNKSTNKN